MNHQSHDIDALLRRNAERQLAGFDWERLRAGIAGRLAAPARPSAWWRYAGWTALATGVAVTVGAVVYTAITAKIPSNGSPVPRGHATVRMTSADHPTGTARVSLGGREGIARCEIKLVESRAARPQARAGPSWCIIAKHESFINGNGTVCDLSNILCLF
jgi:hypothetical protein